LLKGGTSHLLAIVRGQPLDRGLHALVCRGAAQSIGCSCWCNFVSVGLERALAMAGDSGYLAVLQASAVDGGVDVLLGEQCDRTTSEMRGLSPKIILRDSR
jgi:hypothetical protein